MTSGDTALFSHHRPALPALQAGESLEQHDLMMLGKPYLASDPFLSRYRDIAADQFAAVSAERSMDRRMEVLNRVCDMRGGPGQEKVFIAAPFTFEYVSLCLSTFHCSEAQFLHRPLEYRSWDDRTWTVVLRHRSLAGA
jgi:hypothetical protein